MASGSRSSARATALIEASLYPALPFHERMSPKSMISSETVMTAKNNESEILPKTYLVSWGDVLGREIVISGEKFRVIGVMESRGQLFDLDMDNQVFLPLTTAQRLFGTNKISLIFIRVPRLEDIPASMAEAKRILKPLLPLDQFSVKADYGRRDDF